MMNAIVLFIGTFLVTATCGLPVSPNKADELKPTVPLEKVFIAVKTAGKFHSTRLPPILDTWHKSAADRTWFFTDADDDTISRRVGDGHLVNTGCPDDHSRTALSCKMEAELTAFLSSADQPKNGADWFCHFDDDNYVNVDQLTAELSKYSADEDWYIGKVSIPQPLEILDRLAAPAEQRRRVRFWFATGGAGFCLSRAMAEKMRPWIDDGRFQRLADEIRLPDDVAIGYIAEVLLGVQLHQVPRLHSHLEALRLVSDLGNAITLSYSTTSSSNSPAVQDNIVEVENAHGDKSLVDPTRFYAIHCQLRPDECVDPPSVDNP